MKNRRWDEVCPERHELYFTPFYDEELFAWICYEEGMWFMDSPHIKRFDEPLMASTLEGAKLDAEQYIADYFEDEKQYYEDMLQKWREEEPQ